MDQGCLFEEKERSFIESVIEFMYLVFYKMRKFL